MNVRKDAISRIINKIEDEQCQLARQLYLNRSNIKDLAIKQAEIKITLKSNGKLLEELKAKKIKKEKNA